MPRVGLADHRNDVWGVGAFLVGVLAAFAVWLGSAGFIGEVLDDGLALGVGLTRAIVPVALIGIGIGLVMGGKDDDTDNDLDRLAASPWAARHPDRRNRLLHVFRGRPGLDDPIAEVGAAGGALGMAVGVSARPRRFAGAAVILLAIGVIGVIIVTGSSARTVGEFVAECSNDPGTVRPSIPGSLRRSDPGRTGRRSASRAGNAGANLSPRSNPSLRSSPNPPKKRAKRPSRSPRPSSSRCRCRRRSATGSCRR